MIVSFTVRRALSRVIGTPHLWEHFANAAALEAFWRLDPTDRQKLWGDPIDPLSPIANFDPAQVTNAQLAAN